MRLARSPAEHGTTAGDNRGVSDNEVTNSAAAGDSQKQQRAGN